MARIWWLPTRVKATVALAAVSLGAYLLAGRSVAAHLHVPTSAHPPAPYAQGPAPAPTADEAAVADADRLRAEQVREIATLSRQLAQTPPPGSGAPPPPPPVQKLDLPALPPLPPPVATTRASGV